MAAFFAIYYGKYPSKVSFPSSPLRPLSAEDANDWENVLIVIRTGYSVSDRRMALQSEYLIPSFPNVLVLADFNGKYGHTQAPIIDVLANVSDTIWNSDKFEDYHTVHEKDA